MIGKTRSQWRAVVALAITAGFYIAGTPLAAEECGRTYLLDRYRAAVAAEKKQDAVSASRIFHTLADQGFAPAQRRFAQTLLHDNSRPEARQEGLAWLRRALEGSDELAAEAIRNAHITDEEDAAARQTASGWRPQAVECMQDFEQRLRAGRPVGLRDFAADVRIGKDSAGREKIIAHQLLQLIFALYKANPSFLPYLRAIGIIHVAPQPMFAQTVRLDDQSVLTFDEKMLTAPDPERLKIFLEATAEAIRTQVHDQADPPARIAVTHRGRTITAFGHNDAPQAVELIRKGIDLAETLPPDLRKLAGQVKALRYEAPPLGVDVRSNGTYIRDRNLIWFKRRPENVSPRDIAAALVANGVYAENAAQGQVSGPGTNRTANLAGQRAHDLLP